MLDCVGVCQCVYMCVCVCVCVIPHETVNNSVLRSRDNNTTKHDLDSKYKGYKLHWL